MKNKKGTVLMAVGALLLLTALALTAYNLYDEKRAEKNALNALSQIDTAPSEQSDIGIPDYILNPDMPMPTVTVDGEEYIGVLKIPDIGLVLPVISECDSKKLKTAPCRYQGSAYLDNMIIAGHNYKTHMKYIDTLEAGDKIYFTDTDKNEFAYEVIGTEIIDGNDTERMVKNDNWDLTLFTCTYDGRKRITVRAIRVD